MRRLEYFEDNDGEKLGNKSLMNDSDRKNAYIEDLNSLKKKHTETVDVLKIITNDLKTLENEKVQL